MHFWKPRLKLGFDSENGLNHSDSMVDIIVLWVGWMTRMCARRHYRSVSFLFECWFAVLRIPRCIFRNLGSVILAYINTLPDDLTNYFLTFIRPIWGPQRRKEKPATHPSVETGPGAMCWYLPLHWYNEAFNFRNLYVNTEMPQKLFRHSEKGRFSFSTWVPCSKLENLSWESPRSGPFRSPSNENSKGYGTNSNYCIETSNRGIHGWYLF